MHKDTMHHGTTIRYSNFLHKSSDLSREKGAADAGPTQAGFAPTVLDFGPVRLF